MTAWFEENIINHFIQFYEIYIRITLSALLGFIIGWDRESKNKPAGFKTYMYVSVASALITIISIYSVSELSDLHENTRMDPMRLAAQIVTGLGFLGAGVILKDGLKVKGLTSAAMILFAGGVGIGIGAGFYGIVIFTVVVSMTLADIANKLGKNRYGKGQPVNNNQEDLDVQEFTE